MNYSYRRCSLDDMHHGPSAQADRIEAWAKTQGISLERDFFDDGVSGSVPLGDRPEGGEMLSRLANGDCVVAARLDRLFRSVADAAFTMEDWCKRGIKLVSIAEGIDLSNAFSRAVAQIASVFAELERAVVRERTRVALQAKRRRGERIGTVPYGFDAVEGKLVENALEQKALAEMKAWRALGLTLRQIATKLNMAGFPAKRGGDWAPTIRIEHLTEEWGVSFGALLVAWQHGRRYSGSPARLVISDALWIP